MKKRLIYALKCPFTKEVHYIGKSTIGMIRPFSHLTNSHSLKIQEWVNELKLLGYRPEVEIIQYVSETEDIDNVERFVIQKYLLKGNILLNSNLVKPITILPNLNASDEQGIKSISVFLKEKRKRANLSQEQLSEKSGIALTVIRKIEQGKTNVNLDGLITLLAMFGCKIDIDKIKKNV